MDPDQKFTLVQGHLGKNGEIFFVTNRQGARSRESLWIEKCRECSLQLVELAHITVENNGGKKTFCENFSIIGKPS